MYKAHIFNLGITVITFEDLQKKVISFANHRKPLSVFLANVHMLMEAKQDPTFAITFNEADIVASDGVPICFALKLLNKIEQERIAGMDLLPAILQKAAKNNIPVFFYGSDNTTLQKVEAQCKIMYDNLRIAGMYSPPFRELTPEEQIEITDKLNKSEAGIIFVALGCPKQEKFIHFLKNKVNAVMIGIGGALPVFAKTMSRAPLWMQRSGLEWLYRLIQEPKRLFIRYTKTNSKFIYFLIFNYLKSKAKRG